MGVGAAGDDIEAAFHQGFGQHHRVGAHGFLVGLELGAQGLAEGHGLGGDDVHQRAALNAGEDGRVDLFRDIRVVGQDHAAARAAQGFMGGGGGHMRVREGGGMLARRYQTGKMGHIDHQIGTDAVGNLAETGKVDLARDGGAAGDDQFRLVLFGQRLDLVIVQQVVLFTHAVLHRIEPFSRLVRLRAVGQVAAGGEVHAQNRIARFDQRSEHALIGLRAGVRLDVDEFAAEQLFGAINGQRFRDIDEFAAAIVATARITLGVFVGHHRTLRLHDGGRDDVFRGDQLDLVALAAKLAGDGGVKLGVTAGEGFGEKTGVAGLGHFGLLGV